MAKPLSQIPALKFAGFTDLISNSSLLSKVDRNINKPVFLGILLFFLIILPQITIGQMAPAIEWQKVYGGLYMDNLQYVEQTPDGGYILGGYSESNLGGDKTQDSRGGADYWIVRLDVAGNKLWDKTYGGNREDFLFVVKRTFDGGYICGGWSGSDLSGDKTQANRGGYDMWVLKLDANGNKVWDKTYGGTGADVLNTLMQTSDGGYILGGSSGSPAFGDKSQAPKGVHNYWIIEIDAAGNRIWDRTIGGNKMDDLVCMSQTSDGGYILGGDSDSKISGDKSQDSQGQKDFWVVKVDGIGNIIWEKTFGGELAEELTTVHETPEGGYILGGVSNSPVSGDKTQGNYGNYDYWVVKIDVSGKKVWDKTFGGTEREGLRSLDVTSEGGFVLGGSSASGINQDKSQLSKGFSDYWVIKIDANGNKIWDKTLGSSGNESLNSLQQTTDGGYILAGSSYTDIDGDKTIPSQGIDDFWLVKLAPDLIAGNDPEIKIFPNPGQGMIKIQLSGIENYEAELSVFNAIGKLILEETYQVKNNMLSENVILPAAKGIYFLQLKYGDQLLTRKILVE